MKIAISRINEMEIPVCLFFNRINTKKPIHSFFSFISRLGDGVIWYTIMAIMPFLYGEYGLYVTLAMMLTSGPGLAIYKLMKTSTRRLRPYNYSGNITQGTHALDQFSFPSGHTLHAVGLANVLSHYFPEFALIIVPFSALIAMSRLVLGLHYPSDVFAGAALGYLLSIMSLALVDQWFAPAIAL